MGGTKTQTAAFRREIRCKYKELANQAREERHIAAKPTTSKLMSYLECADQLRKDVERPREHVADTEFIKSCAEIGLEMAKSMLSEHKGRTAHDLVEALLVNYAGSGSSSAAKQGPNWTEMGKKVSKYLKSAQGVSCMLGAMEAKLKARKAPVRHEKQQLAALTNPEELEGIAEAEKQETDRNMEEMWQIINSCGQTTVSVANLVCNHNSFSQTVENIFTLSFLVRDQRVRVQYCPELGVVIRPVSKAEKATLKPGEGAQQFVLSFDMCEWDRMKTIVTDGDCMMRNRQPAQKQQQNKQLPIAAKKPNVLGDITNKRILLAPKEYGPHAGSNTCDLKGGVRPAILLQLGRLKSVNNQSSRLHLHVEPFTEDNTKTGQYLHPLLVRTTKKPVPWCAGEALQTAEGIGGL